MKNTASIALSFLLLVMTASALAQDSYPASSIRVVVGFPPGAGTNAIARLIADKLATQMNVSVFVENKPGANGNIGAEYVARSKPDGYTLLVNTASLVLSRAFGEKLGYNMLTDFAPIALVASAPLVLVVHPSVPSGSPAEFIAHLRANPDKLAFSSGGTGNSTHLSVLLFLQANNNLKALHVPYKGGPEGLNDLAGGRIQFAMQAPIAVLGLVKDKRIKAVAVTGMKRSPLLPEVPTLNETAMPGFETGSWFGVVAPSKTPAAIVKRLNGEILKTLNDPDMLSRLLQQAQQPLGSTPEEYGAFLRSDLERWTKIIKDNDIKLE